MRLEFLCESSHTTTSLSLPIPVNSRILLRIKILQSFSQQTRSASTVGKRISDHHLGCVQCSMEFTDM